MLCRKSNFNFLLIFIFALSIAMDGETVRAQTSSLGILSKPKNSISVFSKERASEPKDGNGRYQSWDYSYYDKDSPCYRYIFRPDNTLEFYSICAICYSVEGKLGNYVFRDENTIDIISDSLAIYHRYVDRVEEEIATTPDLNFIIYDKNEEPIGKILHIEYTKAPLLINESKSMSPRHDDLNALIGKKIYLERICLEFYEGEERQLGCITVDQRLKVEAKNYKIFLRENGLRFKKIKNRMYLFQWDHKKQAFMKKHQLLVSN